MNREEVKGVAERLIGAWNAHDPDGAAACYSSEAIMRDVGRQTAMPDRDWIRRSISDYIGAFPDLQAEIGKLGIDGDVAYVEWQGTGTHTGPFMGIPPTGRLVEMHGCTVLKVGADGLIETETAYWDVAGLLQQIGLLPEAPAEAPV
jgi:steroid delta-isomerase-like uncharacterized protein